MDIIQTLEKSFNILKDNYWTILSIVFLWGMIDIIQITNYKGEMRRGVKIWSKDLSDNIRHCLANLHNDYIDENSFSMHQSFIRVRDQEYFICYKSWVFQTPFQYVGYVDLSSPNNKLEFRSSLPLHLFIILLSFSVWTIPPIAIILLISFASEIIGVQRILNKLTYKLKQDVKPKI